ncbi:hypothetical protein EMIT0324P_200008 [Pseudomonas chlororaphis]
MKLLSLKIKQSRLKSSKYTLPITDAIHKNLTFDNNVCELGL